MKLKLTHFRMSFKTTEIYVLEREREIEVDRECREVVGVREGASVLDLSHRYGLHHVHLLWLPLLKCIIILLDGSSPRPPLITTSPEIAAH